MNTEVLLIIGIVAAVAALNLILLCVWFILKSRRRVDTHKLALEAGIPEKLTGRVSMASITLPHPPLPPSFAPTPQSRQPAESSRQFDLSAQISRFHTKVRPPSLVPARVPRASRAPSRTRRPHRALNLTGITPSDMLHISERPLKRGPSTRSAVSADSASLYSAASAPLDFHDRLFQPMALETIPASPGDVPFSEGRTASNMWNDNAIVTRGDSASEVQTPSSPITPAALNVRKDTHSYSTRVRVLTAVMPLGSSTPSLVHSPHPPPRSPLRP